MQARITKRITELDIIFAMRVPNPITQQMPNAKQIYFLPNYGRSVLRALPGPDYRVDREGPQLVMQEGACTRILDPSVDLHQLSRIWFVSRPITSLHLTAESRAI